MSDKDSSPDQLDLLFAAPGAAPSVPTATAPAEMLADQPVDANLPSPEEARLRALQRFYLLLQKLTPVAWVTPLVLIANVIVFVVMVSQGVSPWMPTSSDLLQWGANYSPLTWGGQFWRLFTNVFIHCGLLHLAFNMWALWNVGRFLEKLIGNAGFCVVYVVTGVFGSIASLWWNGDVVSAGASGAIFGLIGTLASFLWNRSDSIPLEPLSAMRGSLATCIFYNLLFGATVEGIDQAAHVGGLLGGLVCGLLLSQPLDAGTRQRRTTKNLVTGAVCGLGLAILVFQHPPPPPDFFLETDAYNQVVPKSLKSFYENAEKFNNKQMSRQELAAWIETELLPPWREIREHFESLSNVPAGRRDHLHQLRTDLILREESWDLLVQALRRNDAAKLAEFQEKQKQAELMEEKLHARE